MTSRFRKDHNVMRLRCCYSIFVSSTLLLAMPAYSGDFDGKNLLCTHSAPASGGSEPVETVIGIRFLSDTSAEMTMVGSTVKKDEKYGFSHAEPNMVTETASFLADEQFVFVHRFSSMKGPVVIENKLGLGVAANASYALDSNGPIAGNGVMIFRSSLESSHITASFGVFGVLKGGCELTDRNSVEAALEGELDKAKNAAKDEYELRLKEAEKRKL